LEQNAENSSADIPSASPFNTSQRSEVESACVHLQNDLTAFLLGILHNRHLADDARQRTVIRAIEAASSARIPTIRGWLFRIALNEARAILREGRRAAHQMEFPAETDDVRSCGPGNQKSFDHDPLISEELRVVLSESLRQLPDEQREVIRRRVYLEMPFAEIAAEMNVPMGTVLTWMRRGVMKLREDRRLREMMLE
jgi:RNA polymerase sigma-70 factor (ECF subfamily)